MRRAFDTVNLERLHSLILDSELENPIKRWLYGYLSGREQRTQFEGKLSKNIKLNSGVPQGGVLSPFLFCWYLKDLPEPEDGVDIICYADDMTVYAQGPCYKDCVLRINNYLKRVNAYFEENQLFPSPSKCYAMLISPWTGEWKAELGVKLGNDVLATKSSLKLLGILFDRGLNFKDHADYLCNKGTKRNNVLRALASEGNGLQKEQLTTVYKTLTRTVFNYAAPCWSPQVTQTNWNKLERKQNQALRTITGCTLMSSVDHLRQETSVLPIETHNKMLTAQFAANVRNPNHPCHETRYLENQRKMKASLKECLDLQCEDLDLDEESGNLKKEIHTATVRKTIARYQPNKLLNLPPPNTSFEIDEKEKDLTRKERIFLAQMRSSYCPKLASYKSRIGNDVRNICRKCNKEEETAEHVIRCIGKMEPQTLWSDPVQALESLRDVHA